ncbi:MAG: DUF523 domain-containing protein [Patescibacteria group bacterium]|jgi:uncharacterized protein YbbK (DUF523 family)
MVKKEKILVSACLLGLNCDYKGGNRLNQKVLVFLKGKGFIPVCPEIYGGFATPRPDAEILGGLGEKVLSGETKVIEPDGSDVSSKFISGAKEILEIAKLSGAKSAILKAKSPSCGCGKTYDGTFAKTLVNGNGVLTALLLQNGIKVITEDDL